jgi:hypothetical protein
VTLNLKKKKRGHAEERVASRRQKSGGRKRGAKRRKFAGAVFCFSGAQPRNSAEGQTAVESTAENIKERRDERRLLQEQEEDNEYL